MNIINSTVAEELLYTDVNGSTGFEKPLLEHTLNLQSKKDKARWSDQPVDGVYGPAKLNDVKNYLPKREEEGKKILVYIHIL